MCLYKMTGFDDPGIYYSDSFFSEERSDAGDIRPNAAHRRFKEFIKTFLDIENVYCYRSGPASSSVAVCARVSLTFFLQRAAEETVQSGSVQAPGVDGGPR